MEWIKSFFSAIGGFFSNFTIYVKAILKILGVISEIKEKVKDIQEENNREEFRTGVVDRDTIKVEDSFDSRNAGVPDKIGDIEWDDEKPKK